MLTLGIETSCDETALALIRYEKGVRPVILAEQISSQVNIHREYGGIVPELASREHLRNLPLLYGSILRKGGITTNQIDCVACTRGPGLKGCLLMGVNFAKGLSLALDRPLIGVNHIEGHIFSPFLGDADLSFPFLALVVSGGHTEILVVKALGEYQLIARTGDDAAGEAFDKSAHLLGIPYPGGPELARLADTVSFTEFSLPKVMREAQGFSFSGLKTAISLVIDREKARGSLSAQTVASLAFAVQTAIVGALVYKLQIAIKETGIVRVAVAGGVSANRHLRKMLGAILGTKVLFPDTRHCMDNGTMIAFVGAMRAALGERMELSADVKSRWPLEELTG